MLWEMGHFQRERHCVVDLDEAPRIVNLRKTNCSIVGALGWAELVSNRSSFTEGQGNVLWLNGGDITQ